MTIPDFQTIMLPLLQLSSDKKEHTTSEAREKLAQHFELTKEERKELLPSGRQPRFANRVGWAATYLRKTKLLESTGRGRFKITQRGLSVLDDAPSRIDLKFLDQFKELEEFRNRTNSDDESTESDTTEFSETPEESLETGFQNLKQKLADDLLERIRNNSPQFFEMLVVDLMISMGYGGTRDKQHGLATTAVLMVSSKKTNSA